MALAAYGLPSVNSLKQVQSFDCLKTSKETLLEIEVRNFVNEFFFGMEEGYRGIARTSYLLKEHKPNQQPFKPEVDQFNIPTQCLTAAPDTTCSIAHYTAAILKDATREKMAMPFESVERTSLGAQAGVEEVRLDMFRGEFSTCEEQSNNSPHRPNSVDVRIVPPFNDGAMHVLAKDKVDKQIRRMETFPCSSSKIAKVQYTTGAKTVDQCLDGKPATMGWTTKPSCKKPPRPPKPISDPLQDRLTRSFSDKGLKLARFEKARSKRRKLAASASNAASVWALIVTFFVIVVLVAQGDHSLMKRMPTVPVCLSCDRICQLPLKDCSNSQSVLCIYICTAMCDRNRHAMVGTSSMGAEWKCLTG
eukprot:c28413_g1_i4 orf=212-1297(-)